MNKTLLAASAALSLAFAGGAAQAAMIVHDPTSYAKLIEEARTALEQLGELKTQVQQGQALFESLNAGSLVSAIAPQLGLPQVREVLPQIEALTAAAKDDLSGLGKIGARADAIRAEARLFTPRDPENAMADLEATGDRAARDLAIGEAVAGAGEARLAGLKELQAAIDTAPNARAVLDLQARALTEQAMIANDQMRLQGLAMAQAAEERLQRQRDYERMEAARAARMAMFRRGFE